MEDYNGLTADDAARKLKDKGLSVLFSGSGETVPAQIPAAGQIIPGGSQVLLYLEEEPGTRMVPVPDFSGMNRQQASDAAGKLGLHILVTGNREITPGVTATVQSIPPETQVPVGTTITLEFTDTAARD